MSEERSKGHIGFSGRWEYFWINKRVVMRAPRDGYIDVMGYRSGARFESTAEAWKSFSNLIEWEKEEEK